MLSRDVIQACHDFEMHALQCPVCSLSGPQCCEDGLKLLRHFYAALNEHYINYNPAHDS